MLSKLCAKCCGPPHPTNPSGETAQDSIAPQRPGNRKAWGCEAVGKLVSQDCYKIWNSSECGKRIESVLWTFRTIPGMGPFPLGLFLTPRNSRSCSPIPCLFLEALPMGLSWLFTQCKQASPLAKAFHATPRVIPNKPVSLFRIMTPILSVVKRAQRCLGQWPIELMCRLKTALWDQTEDPNGRPVSASRWLTAQANLRALATIEAW